MNTMIQIRNVPAVLHRELKSRAALAGVSLSDYLLNEIRQLADRPTLDQMRARLESRPATTLSLAPAEAVRVERDNRTTGRTSFLKKRSKRLLPLRL